MKKMRKMLKNFIADGWYIYLIIFIGVVILLMVVDSDIL